VSRYDDGLEAADQLLMDMVGDPDWSQCSTYFASMFSQHLDCLKHPDTACAWCRQRTGML